MAAIVPITARQDTPQTTGSGTYVTANCATAALANTVEYLVLYRGNCANNDAADSGQLRLRHGTTVIAEMSSESQGVNHSGTGDQCQGVLKVTGDGTSTLNFQFRNTDGISDTAYAGSMSIVAIPLTSLVSGTDYFFSGTSSSTAEVTNAAVGSWTTLRTVDFTLPSTGDYIVIMSGEGFPSNAGDTGNALMVRYRVNGAEAFGPGETEFQKEWEANIDVYSFAFCGVENLTSGVKTFAIECMSRGTAEADYRRSNIAVIRAGAFDQVKQVRDTTGATQTGATFVDFTGLNNTYTPNQTEDVVVLGAAVQRAQTNQCLSQLLLGATARNVDAGAELNDHAATSDGDNMSTFWCTADLAVASAKTYKVQYRNRSGANSTAIGKARNESTAAQSNLIVWGMTLATAANIAGTSAGTSTVTGAITGTGAIAGTAAGTSTVAGALTGTGTIAGASAGTSTVAGVLTGTGAIAGVSAGTSTVAGALTGTGSVAGVSAGTSTVSGTLTGAGVVAGSAAGTSTVTGTLSSAGAIAGASAGTSTVTGAIVGTGAVAGVSVGTSTVAGSLTGAGVIAGASAGTSTVTGTVTGAGVIAGSTAGTSTVVGVLTGTGAIVGSAAGTSTVSGLVEGKGFFATGTARAVDLHASANDALGLHRDTATVIQLHGSSNQEAA
jgi:hypothetical protein